VGKNQVGEQQPWFLGSQSVESNSCIEAKAELVEPLFSGQLTPVLSKLKMAIERIGSRHFPNFLAFPWHSTAMVLFASFQIGFAQGCGSSYLSASTPTLSSDSLCDTDFVNVSLHEV
jgi:hypothetical protein